jgi:hypothetical protein
MRLWTVVLVVAALLAGLTAVMAEPVSYPTYPSWGGPTGVVTLPTAKVAPQGSIKLAADNRVEAEDSTLASRLCVGIAKHIELSAGYQTFDNPWDDRDWTVGLKLGLLSQEKSGVDVAIGGGYNHVWWDSDWTDEENITNAYLAVSKEFKMPECSTQLRATIGGIYYKDEEEGWEDYDFTRPFIALELMGAEGWNLGAEYRWADDWWDYENVVSAVLRYQPPTRPFWVEIGTTNSPWVGFGEKANKFFFGAGYALGK